MLKKIILKIHVFIFIRNIKIPTFRCTVVCLDLFEQICCTILSTVSQMHFKSLLSSSLVIKQEIDLQLTFCFVCQACCHGSRNNRFPWQCCCDFCYVILTICFSFLMLIIIMSHSLHIIRSKFKVTFYYYFILPTYIICY